MSSTAPPVAEKKKPAEQEFTFKQRLILWLVTWMGYLAIRIIGPTLKWEASI